MKKPQSVIVFGPLNLLAKHANRISDHLQVQKVIHNWQGTLDVKHGIAAYLTDNERVVEIAREIGVPPVLTLEEVVDQINQAIPLAGPYRTNKGQFPSRKGIYKASVNARNKAFYRYWDGKTFHYGDYNPDSAMEGRGMAWPQGVHPLVWYGLAQEPIQLTPARSEAA